MTRNHNRDDAFRFNTCDTFDGAPWSDLNHDVLYLVMMQLGVIDFVAFSGICKSWRSLAFSNRKKFMASCPPMLISINDHFFEEEFYLEDIKGRKFKTLLPPSAGRFCVGLTSGYLILFNRRTKDFCLVNPITRHELHFPANHCLEDPFLFKCILVFSHLINRWVFVVCDQATYEIWFSIAGTGAWNHVSSTFDFLDIHAFKGKIYTLDCNFGVCELSLSPDPKLTLLEIKNFPKRPNRLPVFVSSVGHLYIMYHSSQDPFTKLDFGEMKWVSPEEETIGEYIFFRSNKKYDVVSKPEWSQYKRSYDCFLGTTDKSLKGRFFGATMWYFPHDCLNVKFINE